MSQLSPFFYFDGLLKRRLSPSAMPDPAEVARRGFATNMGLAVQDKFRTKWGTVVHGITNPPIETILTQKRTKSRQFGRNQERIRAKFMKLALS
jgi:hypothetical protein